LPIADWRLPIAFAEMKNSSSITGANANAITNQQSAIGNWQSTIGNSISNGSIATSIAL